jgi:hypothetical protein
MSSPIHHAEDLDPLLKYAPPRVRDRQTPAESAAPAVDWPWRRQFDDDDELQDGEEPARAGVRPRLTLEPEWVPEPPLSAIGERDWWRILLRTASVLGFAALVAWVAVSMPAARRLGTELMQAGFSGKAFATRVEEVFPTTLVAKTRAAVQARLPESGGERATLRAPMHRIDPVEAAPPVPMPEPAPVAITSPTAPEQPLPAATTPRETVAVKEPKAPDFVVRQIDRADVTAMLERAEGFIKSGDLSSARLLLRRAAEGGSVYAAMTLAGTFDPNVRKTTGLQEGVPDIAVARLWYERAEQLGATDAARRLQQLATADTTGQ